MKVSLVLATIGRTEEVRTFLRALNAQTYRNFELIIVDQNPDDRLIPLLDPYRESFSIIHVRSERGLSKARNVGLSYVTGDIVSFPDDDCWYDENLLETSVRYLEKEPDLAGITGRSIDDAGREVNGIFRKTVDLLNRNNVWECAISYTIFLRRTVVAQAGGFDETLGVGANTMWGSGEETDFLLRVLDAGIRLQYLPNLTVRHPDTRLQVAKLSLSRAYLYGCGTGRVLQRHEYKWSYKTRFIVRPLLGALLKSSQLKPGEALRHICTAAGRIRGIVSR